MCSFNILLLLALTLLLGVSRGYETITHEGNLHHIFLDEHNTSNLLISGVNVIFQFQNGSLANIVHRLSTYCMHKNLTDLLETDNVPRVFRGMMFNGQNHVLFCGSVQNSPCSIHNVSDISNFRTLSSDCRPVNIVSGRPSLVIDVKTLRPSLHIFAAISRNGSTSNEIFSHQTIDQNRIGRCNTSINISPNRFEKYFIKPYNYFEFIFGFNNDDFLYVLRNTPTSDSREAYISQMCKRHVYLFSYMEAKLRLQALILKAFFVCTS